MRPHWIVADSFHYWAAAEHKVSLMMLLPTAAMVAAVLRPSLPPERAAFDL